MKKFLIVSLLMILPMTVNARGGYYYTQTNNCNHAQMRAELDRATVHGRAVITTVRCNNGNINKKQNCFKVL